MLDHLPIRWRLAAISSLLTFVILSTFAVVIGELTARRVRSDFNNQLVAAVENLSQRITISVNAARTRISVDPNLDTLAAPENAIIRILNFAGDPVKQTRRATDLGEPQLVGTSTVHGILVASRSVPLQDRSSGDRAGAVYIQYGRRLSDLEATVRRVRVFLLFGVFGGTAAALLGGFVLARRAMGPITGLTATAKEIARTRDPNRRVPVPQADDEVAELARTLDDMLQSLESSRAETTAMLGRQRQFVADASHELRTPLTSVLANLELLVEVLDGEQGDAARSALRSSRRMRRLVADLLLLARADAKRDATRTPTDLGQVVVDAAAELGPLAAGHEVTVDAERGLCVDGARDELHRLALNLMENALKHTPPDTPVRATVDRDDDGRVRLVVEDEGPGVPDALRGRIFERFVRGAGDRGGSFGLGLSIVRAVAVSHGGGVELHPRTAGPGARFVVTLPASSEDDTAEAAPAAAVATQPD